jgi:hypothetical protein
MFTVALFTIAMLWNWPRYQTTNEWIKEMWYTNTMGYYSAIKNEIMSFAGKWMELEIIMCKISQIQKDKQLHIFAHMLNLDLQKF